MEALARAFSIHYLKGKCIKTRLPERHGGEQCDRRETQMVGENQPHDQPSKLEGCVRGGGGELNGGCLDESGKSEHQVGETEKGTPFVFLHA